MAGERGGAPTRSLPLHPGLRLVNDLYDRAARALGWKPADARTVSMRTLRDLVRPVDPDLAQEMTLAIQSGAYPKGTVAPKEPEEKDRQGPRRRRPCRTALHRQGTYDAHQDGAKALHGHDAKKRSRRQATQHG